MKFSSSWPGRFARPAISLLVFTLSILGMARAGVVAEWNEAFERLAAVPDTARPFHLDVRAQALAHVAIARALDSMPAAWRRQHGDAARARVAIGAAEEVAATLWRAQQPLATDLAGRQWTELAECDDAQAMRAHGREAARMFLAERAIDGWSALLDDSVGLHPDRSERLARELALGGKQPESRWLTATPFGLRSARQIRVTEVAVTSPDGSTRRDPAITGSRLFRDVQRSGSPAEIQAAWADSSRVAWNRIARAIAARENLGVGEEARLFAALNAALADAMLAAAHWSFVLGSWRTMTIEQFVDARDVPHLSEAFQKSAVVDSVGTAAVHQEFRRALIPPTLNYPSMRATLAGAAQTAIESVMEANGDPFTVEVPRAGAAPLQRSFGSVAGAAAECAFVSSLDGRHTREAAIAGHLLGTQVGREIARRLRSAQN